MFLQVMRFFSGTASCCPEQRRKKFTISFWNLRLNLKWNWWYPDPLGESELFYVELITFINVIIVNCDTIF